MTKRPGVLLFSLLTVWYAARAGAAACCGGGFSAPSLLAGDDRGQITASLSAARVFADVGADQLWRPREDGLTLETFRLEGATLLADRWQLGGTLPLVSRERDSARATGAGDVALNLTYEYLTDWTYHPYRPKALGYVRLLAPTGRDPLQVADPLEARGRGFWATGLGTWAFKTREAWDAFANAELHYSWPRAHLNPGWGAEVGLGLGYNVARVRFGVAAQSAWEAGIFKNERVTTASVSLGVLVTPEWAATLSYSDQTWLGSPTNTSLARGVLAWVQRRWPR